jgi:hypothetical protein
MHRTQLLEDRLCIKIGFDLVYDDCWINPSHLFIAPRENIMEFLKEGCVNFNLLEAARFSKLNVFHDTSFL